MRNAQFFYIVRLSHTVVPTGVSYVAHDDTDDGLKLRFGYFRDSASRYHGERGKRIAVREAQRLAKVFNAYAFKVNADTGHTVWSSLERTAQ